MNAIVLPGDSVGDIHSYECGSGVVVDGSVIRATIIGSVVKEKQKINVVPVRLNKDTSVEDVVLDVGDVVLARVTRINVNQVNVNIISVGEVMLRESPKAIIRRENMRLSETDTLVTHECFRPGDIVRGIVISLGDARQYFLSTAEAEYGVVWAQSESSSEYLVPISWKEMEDPVTKRREPRKVAKPN